MKDASAVKFWEKTKLQNLVRHKSGRYYARLFRNGKEVWKSLKTAHYSVAESRLGEELKKHREITAINASVSDAKMTFGQAAALHMQNLADKVTIKPSTRVYWKEVLKAVCKSWPGLAETEVRRITPGMCQEWAAKYARKVSPTRFNNSMAMVRHVLKVAIKSGVLAHNPALELERVRGRQKELELPSRAQFTAFIAEMRKAGGRDSKNCADFAEGLSYTGCRRSEAARLKWQNLDFRADEITVRGDPVGATKNGEIRRIPMVPQAKLLFEKMRQDRKEGPASAGVFQVHECQKAMDRAAKKVDMARITHHDLRHFFATICIESGVDIPTVSHWLGHKDGGALAMRTYGHLRREHSASQARRVSFQSTDG